MIDAVAAILAAQPGEHWREVFASADCCCSVVDTLEEAVRNSDFTGRGLFSGSVTTERGATIPALPLPLMDVFRDGRGVSVEDMGNEMPAWRERTR